MKSGLLLIYLVSAISFLPATISAESGPSSTSRPLELIVLRGDNADCDMVTLRDTQHVRGIQGGQVYTSRVPILETQEKISLIAYDEDSLWYAAGEECGATFVEKLRSASTVWDGLAQNILTVPTRLPLYGSNAWEQAPPLEVVPLIKSGDSSNRVDLVFFSDGCTSSIIIFCD
jgi:hypothetical protein